MTGTRQNLLNTIFPIFIGLVILLGIFHTCQRFDPELLLEISTDDIDILPDNEYKFTGSVLSFGIEEITQHGFCYGEITGPTVTGASTELGRRISLGSFTSTISNLSSGTKYYVRAYATTNSGTEYGEEFEFETTPPSIVILEPGDSYDFSTGTFGTFTGGDFYLGPDGDYFAANNLGQRGLQDLGDLGPTELDEINPPNTDYWRYGTEVIEGHTYSSQAQEGEERNYIIFKVIEHTIDYVKIEYYYLEDYLPGLPIMGYPSIINITDNSAQCSVEITSDGGDPITARGICWSTSPNPTISDLHSVESGGTGSFTSNLTGLERSTLYYVTAYAENSVGIVYTLAVFLFRTYEGTIIDFDGNEYWTVRIGSQDWIAENLKVTHYSDGTAIQSIESNIEWDALTNTSKAYCWYDNNLENLDIYGGLYTWAAAMNGAASSDLIPSNVQGVCPSGWHLPSDSEWKELEMYLGMSQEEADKEGDRRGTYEGWDLKEDGLTHWYDGLNGSSNSSGFTALPSGDRTEDGTFRNLGWSTTFWSTTNYPNDDYCYVRGLHASYSDISRGGGDKLGGFPVRCIKD